MAAILGAAARAGVAAVLAALKSPKARSILAAVGLTALVEFFDSTDIFEEDKAKVPRYALVDLKRNQVLVFMSARRAYRLLLRPRGRGLRTKVVVVGNGQQDIRSKGIEVIR